MKVVCLYFDRPQPVQAIAEVFYRFTPQIAVRGESSAGSLGRAIFLEISKCDKLYDEHAFLKRTQLILKRLALNAQMSVAEDIPTALSQAVFKNVRKELLPIEAIRFYADPLAKNPEGDKKLIKAIETLRSLSLVTLGDFVHLSSREILARFGPLVLTAYLRIKCQYDLPWEKFAPSEVMGETFKFDPESPVDNLEPIYFRLMPMLEKIFLRLRGMGKRARQFKVILQQEHAHETEHRDYEVTIILQLPYISHKATFQIVKEKLEAQIRLKPFRHRISEVSVEVLEEVPYFMNQRDIFDQKREENAESFFQFVSRVATKLGERAVFYAQLRESYLPEKNWLRVPEFKESEPTENHVPERPMRLFRAPIPIRFIGKKVLLPEGPDEVVNFDNQETLLSDWWDSPIERVYFRIFTKTGLHYWVFKTKHGHFLHGIFD